MNKLVNKLYKHDGWYQATVSNNSKVIFYSKIDRFMADLLFTIVYCVLATRVRKYS